MQVGRALATIVAASSARAGSTNPDVRCPHWTRNLPSDDRKPGHLAGQACLPCADIAFIRQRVQSRPERRHALYVFLHFGGLAADISVGPPRQHGHTTGMS
jgi:hypothetical protein